MDWEFDHAPDGNIALTGELDLDGQREFTMGLAFGNTEHCAITTLFQALGVPFKEHHKRYTEQWERSSARLLPLEKVSADRGQPIPQQLQFASRSRRQILSGRIYRLTLDSLGRSKG